MRVETDRGRTPALSFSTAKYKKANTLTDDLKVSAQIISRAMFSKETIEKAGFKKIKAWYKGDLLPVREEVPSGETIYWKRTKERTFLICPRCYRE